MEPPIGNRRAEVPPAQVPPAQVPPAQVAPPQVAPPQVAPMQVAPMQVAPMQLSRSRDDADDYDLAIAYLYGRIDYERTAETAPYPFRLRRMNELLDRLDLHGVAGAGIPVVHIAGTKGKGSTSTMVAAMLSAGGFRTGLYTSPHLERLEERFVVDGVLPDPQQVIALIEAVRVQADRVAADGLGESTFFELTTAVALLHFRNCDCEAVVLEVGLGGKLDSTNVCHPAVTAITSIGFDHQHILGHTLGDIAIQKAGIIKPGVPIVSGVVQSEAALAITQTAVAKQAQLFAIGKQFECRVREPQDVDGWRTTFDLVSHDPLIRDRAGWTLPLEGAHQAANATVACAIIDLLANQQTVVSLAEQQRSLSQMHLAGRVERFAIRADVDVVLDTAHNVDSVDALCRCIASRKAGRPVTIVFGTSRDKAHPAMLALLSEHADCLVLTRYHGNPRYRDPAELQRELSPDQLSLVIDDPESAVLTAIGQQTGPHLIIVCGSFFLAAEVRPLLRRLAEGEK